jgi:hypothetical protein
MSTPTSRRFQFSLTVILLLLTCIALAAGWWGTWGWHRLTIWKLDRENQELRQRLGAPRDTPSDAMTREGPMTVVLSTWGDFALGSSWDLTVNSSGKAELTISSVPQDVRTTFDVPADQLVKLRELLISEQFFALGEGYGETVADSSTRSITISVGPYTKTVRLNYLGNWLQFDKSMLIEPARAMRVMTLVRGWFDHAEAVDLRKYDQVILDAVDDKGN